MISFISSWTQGIIVSVIIASIIEMILPDGNSKKYVKVVIGVFILFSIVSPVINKFTKKEINISSIVDVEKYSDAKQVSSTNLEENTIFHTLIVSPPGAGKTTILKDLVRKISDGIPEIGFKGIDVSLIDERGEISAMYNGVPQNKIGIRTDVLENVSKPIGIKMAVRSMAPKVIVADEIGNYNDIEAINYAVCSGVKGIFTAHSLSYETMMLNKELNKLINMKIIERIIFLDSKTKGKIKNVYLLAEDTKNYLREVVKN